MGEKFGGFTLEGLRVLFTSNFLNEFVKKNKGIRYFHSFSQLSKLPKEAAFFRKVISGNIKDADFTLQDQSEA